MGNILNTTDSTAFEPITEMNQPSDAGINRGLKRAFDFLAAFFGLVLLSPFFLIITILLHKDSPGPTYFRGWRTGLKGKKFLILKFRTMYEHVDSYNGLPVTGQKDGRITPFGRWLRDTKINELPQLWNVLKGDMSLVGPRPEDPEIVATWAEDIRREVLSVRPGVTSPASIVYRDEENLLAGDGVMDTYLYHILPEKLRLDQLYIRNHGFLSDLDIIFMTLIMLLPRIRQFEVNETRLFSGPFFNFARRFVSWFFIDTIVAFIAISITGIFWRLSEPLNLGFGPALGIALAIALMIGIINTLVGLKKITWRYASPLHVIDLAISAGISLVLLALIDRFVFIPPLIPLGMVWNFGSLVLFGLVVVRYRERIITGLASRWISTRGRTVAAFGERVLIIGAGECGELAVWLLKKSKFANVFSIAGYVDDDFHKQNFIVNNYPILGTTRDIPNLVEKNNIGVILYAISKCSHADRKRILDTCKSTTARLVIIPNLMEELENSLQSKKE
jgi:lipopolysaccharide/colanic/teichoic acid biosynthesis glycosyltransferase